jgi:hypothetical protein
MPPRRAGGAIGFDEAIECGLSVHSGFRRPDVLQRPLGFCVQALWKLVQDIRGFVHPTPLRTRLRPHLIDRPPEAERPVGHGKLRRHRQTAPLEIEEELLPRLRSPTTTKIREICATGTQTTTSLTPNVRNYWNTIERDFNRVLRCNRSTACF